MSGQNIFITGVSSGIGYGLAARYLQRGDTVFGVSRRTPDETLMANENFHFAALDLLAEEKIPETIATLLTGCQSIDTAILNAGVLGEIADMRQTSLKQLRWVMDTNVWSNKSLIDALYELSIPIKRVITISSGAAINGSRGWNGYSISKAALNMLTMLYARENEGTHFAAVAPGLVDTAMQDYLCDQPADNKYPSLEALKSKRGTDDMPGPIEAADRLIPVFDKIEALTESGGFIDIRNLDAS